MSRIVVALFPGYEILDVFGPLEFYAMIGRLDPTITKGAFYTIHFISHQGGSRLIPCSGGPSFAFTEHDIDDELRSQQRIDILLIPGGFGTRSLVKDESYLKKLFQLASQSKRVCTVCTGSGLLAKTGFLDGKQATSNKISFDWATQQSLKVNWKRKARWVEDGNIWTSSGISAGMDMTLAIIAKDHGINLANEVAKRAEYIWNKDSELDLFANL